MKSKARADRWHEEVQLLKEEMRRVLAFLEWKAAWWAEEGGRDLGVRPDIADGVRAYAAKQASINHALARSFKIHWESAFETQGQTPSSTTKRDEDDSTDSCEFTSEADKHGGAEFGADVD